MTVEFSKESLTFNQQNIIDILSIVPDVIIRSLAESTRPGDYIKVMGDIHKSQLIPDKKGLFWFKIKAYENDKEIPHLSSAHIFVCFRLSKFDKKKKMYVYTKKCINPRFRRQTDMPYIMDLMGGWDFVDITYK